MTFAFFQAMELGLDNNWLLRLHFGCPVETTWMGAAHKAIGRGMV